MIIPERIGALRVFAYSTWDDDFGGVRFRLSCRDARGRRLNVEQRIDREDFNFETLDHVRRWMLKKVEDVAGSIKETDIAHL